MILYGDDSVSTRQVDGAVTPLDAQPAMLSLRWTRVGLGAVFLLLTVSGFQERFDAGDCPPCSPEQALRMFEIEDGFEIELFAAEPLIRDPIAMEIDEEGRIYVVELTAYPNLEERLSTILLLMDGDGDGRPDSSVVFADSLWMPKGLMRWKNGLLVTDAPDILYFQDTNGDGRADRRTVVLTGFGTVNPQLGVNTPLYGLDNWIQLGHWDRSLVTFPEAPEDTFDVSRRNVRLRPVTREIDTRAGATQFGHTFDAFGRHILTNNAEHIYQEVIEASYLRRNPELIVGSAVAHIPEHGPAADVFPIAMDSGHQLFTDRGVFTSASGITAYLGGAFPGYEGVTFVGEPQHNLVHTDRLLESGASLVARRTHESREFLASRDSWFRPVNFYVGPDAALYVIDYYRDVIEQPKYLADDVTHSERLFAGTDRGRIWRIMPKGGLPYMKPSLRSTSDLISSLESPNIWHRRTAQRLLVDRRDEAAIPALKSLVHSGKLPETRVHALWTLQDLSGLETDVIAGALDDSHAGVREHAIRLAEMHLTPALIEQLVSMNPGGREAFQLLLTLGSVTSEAAARKRRRLLYDNLEDDWFQIASLTAADIDASALLDEAAADLSGHESPGRRSYFRRLGSLIGSGGRIAEIKPLLAGAAEAAWWRGAVLEGLAEGLRPGAHTELEHELGRLLDDFFDETQPVRTASLRIFQSLGLPKAADRAPAIAKDPHADADLRADAVRLIALGTASAHEPLLRALIDAREPLSVQLAAVDALRGVTGEDLGRFLLDEWPGLTPQVRSRAVDLLLAENSRVALLVSALEAGRVQPSVIGWMRSKHLIGNPDPQIRERSRALFARRDEDVLSRFANVLQIDGDIASGSDVFERACAMCHQIGGRKGIALGPDLAGVRSRAGESLLTDILLPNREIASGYEQWTVRLTNGRRVSGIISSETPSAVTLRAMGEPEQTIPRAEIARIEAEEASVMPEGLEEALSEKELADLITFLKSPPN